MAKGLIQDFTCETTEGRGRYAEVLVTCRLVVDAFGVSIDAVKQADIRKAIWTAVEEAVTVEAPAKKEERHG